MAVRDPTSSLFPEVVAIEFDKVLFNTNTHVIVVVADVCSELPAAKTFVDTHHTTQLAALSEPLCIFRMADLQVLLFSDVNGYALDFSGYGGGESEYDTSIGKKLLSKVDWLLRRISCCSHTRKNCNGKESLSLCTSAELIIVNGVQRDRLFDSKCTRAL